MKTNSIFFILALFFSFPVFAQIQVDLSKNNITSESISSELQPMIVVKNMLPPQKNIKYSFSIEMKEEQIPPITIGNLSGSSCTEDDNSKAYTDALKKFNDAKDETDMPKLIEKLQKEIDKLNSNYQGCKDEGNEAILSTTYTKSLQFSIRNNQTIIVTVKKDFKTKKNTDTSKTWIFTFKTPTKSPWSLMYGFTFIPNSMNPVTHYFSKVDTSGKLFTITPMNNDRHDYFKNISPTLMINWRPLKTYSLQKGNCNWRAILSNNFYQLGFTAGLSINFSSDVANANVLVAPSLIIAQNVALSAGVAMTQKQVLKGQYKAGDILKENLDFDQLHENRYMAEWFVSLAIRFDQNPFAKKDEKKE